VLDVVTVCFDCSAGRDLLTAAAVSADNDPPDFADLPAPTAETDAAATARLRAMGRVWGSVRWLVVPLNVDARTAHAFAERCGGYLACPSTVEKDQALGAYVTSLVCLEVDNRWATSYQLGARLRQDSPWHDLLKSEGLPLPRRDTLSRQVGADPDAGAAAIERYRKAVDLVPPALAVAEREADVWCWDSGDPWRGPAFRRPWENARAMCTGMAKMTCEHLAYGRDGRSATLVTHDGRWGMFIVEWREDDVAPR
jgi:hypothetical protein